MAYEAQTVEGFYAKFPEFEDVDSEVIEPALAEAELFTDDTWFESNRPLAVLYLAAHLVAASQAAIDVAGGTGNDGVKSFSLGSVSFTLAAVEEAASAANWGSTPYGLAFERLLRLNHPAVLIV